MSDLTQQAKDSYWSLNRIDFCSSDYVHWSCLPYDWSKQGLKFYLHYTHIKFCTKRLCWFIWLIISKYFGPLQRDIYYCTVWFILNVGSLAFSVVLFGIDLAFDEKSSMAGYITLEILDFLRQLYFLWVVGAFILELKEEDSTQPPYVDDLSTARNPYSV